MRISSTIGFLTVTLLAAEPAYAERPELIEITTAKQKLQGKAVASSKRTFWLLGRDGRVHRLPIRDVKKFRKISPTFRGLPAADMRSRLRKEFGKKFEVAGTVRYLVLAPKGRSKKYATIFEDVYRAFSSHFSARRFRIQKPKFPLVAIVFPTKKQFLEYARRDGITGGGGMLGYYHRLTNRVALYDALGVKNTALEPGEERLGDAFGRLSGVRGVRSRLFDVIVHEATHQAAFNTGLHSRVGPTPSWVVEGLATVFEAPGLRNRSARRGAKSRINRDYYLQFRNYMKRRRKPKSLESLLADDSRFRSAVHDAYAEAWALSFYLIENRSSDYTTYLREIAARDPLKPYTAKQRVDDFKKAFGDDLARLEARFLKWISRLR